MSRTILRNIKTSDNPILAFNEIGYDSIGGILKIGNGQSKWSELPSIQGGSDDDMATVLKGTAAVESDKVVSIGGFKCSTLPKVAWLYLATNTAAASTATVIKPMTITYIDGAAHTTSYNSSGKMQISSLGVSISDDKLTFTSTNALGFSTSDTYHYIIIY